MDLYLQFGYGMMEHCRHLLNRWQGGTVVLSPRDLTDRQLRSLSTEVTELKNGRVLLDSQLYLPHADHERLCSHSYWPTDYETGSFFDGAPLRRLVDALCELNQAVSSSAVILPGLLATRVDDPWLATQEQVLKEFRSRALTTPLLA